MLWPKASPLDMDFGLCARAKLFKKKVGENNGQLRFVLHHGWRTQARLDKKSWLTEFRAPLLWMSKNPLPSFICKWTRPFQFKKNLPRHMNLAHQNKVPKYFVCEVCTLEFSTPYHLDRHQSSKNCLKNLSYQCKECKKRFVAEEKLKIHKRKNCTKKYFCSECFKFFQSNNSYQNHIKTAHQ